MKENNMSIGCINMMNVNHRWSCEETYQFEMNPCKNINPSRVCHHSVCYSHVGVVRQRSNYSMICRIRGLVAVGVVRSNYSMICRIRGFVDSL